MKAETLLTLVLLVVDLLTIVLITWSVWEIAVNRNVSGFLTRAITAIAMFSIFTAVAPKMLVAPSTNTDKASAQVLYDSSVGVITTKLKMLPEKSSVKPGFVLVQKGVEISQAIWTGIVSSGLIFLPLAWCLITWAIEIAKGGGWLSVGMKALFLTLLLAIAAGPVSSGLPAQVFKIAGTIISSVCTAIVTPTLDKASDIPPKEWTVPLVIMASSNAKVPTGLTSVTSPYIGSCERTLDAPALKMLRSANYIGNEADGIVANLWYVSQSPEADPKDFLNLATPIENKYDHLFTELVADDFIRRHYMDSDNTVFDATKSKVGFIKIGAAANPSDIIAEEYNRERLAFIDKLNKTNDSLRNSNGDIGTINANTQRIKAAMAYKPPTVLPVSTIAALPKIREFISNYTVRAHQSKPSVLPQFAAIDPDAWTLLWLTSDGRNLLGAIKQAPTPTADPSASPGTGTPNAAPAAKAFKTGDFFREWAANENILNALARNEQAALTQEPSLSIWNLWDTIKSLIVMFFMSLAEGGMALAMLIMKLLVMLLAPMALMAGLFMVSVGIFVCCCAYPIAAFMSLFPGRWAILLDWTKGVLWCMTWIPIMLVGMSLCEFNASDISAGIQGVLSAIPGFAALKGAAFAGASAVSTQLPGIPSEYVAPGLITTSFISTIVGIFLICASPLVANLVFNPGIAGISSLTSSMMTQVAGKVGGAAAAPLLAAGAGAMAGIKAGAAGAGNLIKGDQEKKLADAGSIPRGASPNTAVTGGSGMQSLAKQLGGSTSGMDEISKAASAAAKLPGGGLASRLATGATAGAQAMGSALKTQMGRQLQGAKAMLNPEGITPAAARFSQAAAAAVRGDLLGAESFAKGHGEHTSDADFAGRGGRGGSPGGGKGDQSAKPGAGTIAPAPGTKPEISAALAARKDAHERSQGAQAAAGMLAGGRGGALEASKSATEDSHLHGVESLQASKDGNLPLAAVSASASMQSALQSGDAGLAGHAASRFLKAHATEAEHGKTTGAAVPNRAREIGMAEQAIAAQRSEVQAQASASGIALPESTHISPVSTDEDKQRHEAIAAQHIENYDHNNPQTWSSSGKAMVAAMRSGNPSLIHQARSLVGETAQQACQMAPDNAYKAGALRDAGVGLAVASPTSEPESYAMPAMDLPVDTGGAGSEQYQTMMTSAQNGERILASSRQPDPGLLRSTMGVARLALASARHDNNPAHIAEASSLVHRTASMAARLPASHPDTPSVQMDAADGLMEAASGCEQASQIHETHTSDLMRAADDVRGNQDDPVSATALTNQSEVHFQRHVQMRGQSSALQIEASKMARTAVSSGRVGAAIGGSQRMGTLNQVYSRAEPILRPSGDQRPAELEDSGPVSIPPVDSTSQREPVGTGNPTFRAPPQSPQAEG